MESNNVESVRIDRWLWSVRICKTRTVATDLCKRLKVSVDGQKVKPSREVKVGQIVIVRRDGIDWTFKVLKCIEKRVGAKIAAECREDLTPEEEINKLRAIKGSWTPRREKGEGRPTKKDRRDLEKFLDFE